MKWVAYAFTVLIAAVWQVTCWTSWGPMLFHAVSWPITLVLCLALEGGLYAASLKTDLDEEGRMNRRVGRALYPATLVVPIVPFWECVVPVLGAIAVFRLCRTGALRHLVPSIFGITGVTAGVALIPWRSDPLHGGLLGWAAVLSGILLLAYESWLIRASYTRAKSAGPGHES